MSAVVLPFPGVDLASVRPRPRRIADLPDGAKALVIVRHAEAYRVVVRPAVTTSELEFHIPFSTLTGAWTGALELARTNPALYQLVTEDLGRARLHEIMDEPWPPFDRGSAA